MAGEKDRALANLERALQNGFAERGWIDNDTDWDSVRDDPRFEKILAQIKAAVCSYRLLREFSGLFRKTATT